MDNKVITPKSILFVCLGNICRSPAAEAILLSYIYKKIGDCDILVDSAGTYGGHAGQRADQRMRSAASKRGYNLLSRSRAIVSDDFEKFDLIFAMDDSVYENLKRLAPDIESTQKVQKFADYIEKYDIDYVPDPYYEGKEGFEIVLDILEDGCFNILKGVLKTL
ncbi:MAG: low molecular weight protein-tyrosine-phosphatase [Rikenellaceae bacterium]